MKNNWQNFEVTQDFTYVINNLYFEKNCACLQPKVVFIKLLIIKKGIRFFECSPRFYKL